MHHALTGRRRFAAAVFMIANLALTVGAGASAQSIDLGPNIARGASYRLSPAPNYAHCTDPGDASQLTDGQLTEGYFWTQQGTVGWQGAKYVIVTVDLGRVEPVAGVSFRTAAGTAGVSWPASIRVQMSSDGKSYRDVGDLLELDASARDLPASYAVRRLATTKLRTHGRYVRFLVIPTGPYLFTDEIEVFRGDDSLLQPEPATQPAPDPEESYLLYRIESGIRRRFEADVTGVERSIRDSRLDTATKDSLLSRLAEVHKKLMAAVRPDSLRSFQTILPFDDAHASVFRVQAALWRASERPALSAWAACPWDPLDPFAALAEIPPRDGTWVVTIPPGLPQQIWLTFHVTSLPDGQHAGSIVIKAQGMPEIALPLHLQVNPLSFPARTTLWLGGWSYTDGDGQYGITPANHRPLVEHLRSHFVNAPWATARVMMSFSFRDAAPTGIELDTGRFDDWLGQWPDARAYLVFLAVDRTFAGTQMGSTAFDQRVGQWISAWVRHLATKGVTPDRLGLLLVDEPRAQDQDDVIIAWAKAIHAAEPKVLIWEDPIYPNPREGRPQMFELSDILCPNRPMWLSTGKEIEGFYRDQQRRGRTLQLYSCSGPARLLDPYAYYRLQAWHCWQIGATGSFFWAFGDNSGASSWNEYAAIAGPYTPLYLDDRSVTPAKQMEAIRESVEDYEYFVLLDRMVKAAPAEQRTGPALTTAQSLLQHAADDVLAAEGATALNWHAPKDRTRADVVRVELLKALADLSATLPDRKTDAQ